MYQHVLASFFVTCHNLFCGYTYIDSLNEIMIELLTNTLGQMTYTMKWLEDKDSIIILYIYKRKVAVVLGQIQSMWLSQLSDILMCNTIDKQTLSFCNNYDKIVLHTTSDSQTFCIRKKKQKLNKTLQHSRNQTEQAYQQDQNLLLQ